jgi:hypothetical protein
VTKLIKLRRSCGPSRTRRSQRVVSQSRLSQRRCAGADERLRSASSYSRAETKGRRHWQGRGEQKQVGVTESRASVGRVRQESAAATGRVCRAQLRPLLRDGCPWQLAVVFCERSNKTPTSVAECPSWKTSSASSLSHWMADWMAQNQQ